MTSPNPVLRRLGFSENDRVAIIHTDDIGMCLASVNAFADLWEFGLISSGAVMTPCPWFLKAAQFAREHPQADLGVHSTLTCEWKTYRWGPISTRDPNSGLIDEEGYFYHRTDQAQAHADPLSVYAELEAQVQRQLQMGMSPTHIDTHMGTVASFKLIPQYLKVALTHRLPPMVFRMDLAGWRARGLDVQSAEMAVAMMGLLEGLGMPLLDTMHGLDLGKPDNKFEQAKQAFADLQPGITHFIIHPSQDTYQYRRCE